MPARNTNVDLQAVKKIAIYETVRYRTVGVRFWYSPLNLIAAILPNIILPAIHPSSCKPFFGPATRYHPYQNGDDLGDTWFPYRWLGG